MFHYLVTVAYDGSDFAGWAKQPNQFTVQGYIEDKLSKIFKSLQTKISVLATSRTDKGVHARDQNFTLRLNLFFSPRRLFNLLEKLLGEYMQIKKVKRVSPNFHPLRHVISKEYRYFINTGRTNIFQRKYCWEYNLPLEINKLTTILRTFQGQHNFFNFCYCRTKTKINTVRAIDFFQVKKKGKLIIISIKGKSFLRYQIRILIGETINCYEGHQSIKNLQTKLLNWDKPNYKYRHIAPASGLYLWKINYEK